VRPAVIRKVIYPAYRALRHDKVLWRLAEMRRIQTLPAQEIRDIQWLKLKALLKHASSHVPYYRRVFRDLGICSDDVRTWDDFARLPVLTKTLVRENLREFISETSHSKHLEPEETGGSTGENLFFYVDHGSGRARLASNIGMNEWTGIRVGDRTAYLWGQRFREPALQRRISAVKHWFSNTLYLSAYRMDTDSVRGHLAKLRRFGPDLVIGYPSALYHFCEVMSALGGYEIRPKAVLVSGETAYDWQRDAISGAFAAPVYSHYGCCEFGAVARECRMQDGLHIAASRVVIECGAEWDIDGAARPSELVITDLDNYGMPFIRYAIEDLGAVIWEPCACGLTLPRIRELVGRVYDIVRAPNGNCLSGTFWGHILKEGVHKFQVVQDALDTVTIAIVPTSEFNERVKARILERVQEACGPSMKVIFNIRDSIEPTRTGKHRYVISKFVPTALAGPGA